jgi:hypothetical protein
MAREKNWEKAVAGKKDGLGRKEGNGRTCVEGQVT